MSWIGDIPLHMTSLCVLVCFFPCCFEKICPGGRMKEIRCMITARRFIGLYMCNIISTIVFGCTIVMEDTGQVAT